MLRRSPRPAIAERVARTAPGQWIVASSGWHESLLAEGRLPTRFELDQVSPDHPVFIPRGGHVVTVNSKALELAGVKKDTPDPKGGGVEHGPRVFNQPTCHHAPELYPGIGEVEAGTLLRMRRDVTAGKAPLDGLLREFASSALGVFVVLVAITLTPALTAS